MIEVETTYYLSSLIEKRALKSEEILAIMKIIKNTQTQLIVEHSQQASVRVTIIMVIIVGLEAVIENLFKFHTNFSWVISGLIVALVSYQLPDEFNDRFCVSPIPEKN